MFDCLATGLEPPVIPVIPCRLAACPLPAQETGLCGYHQAMERDSRPFGYLESNRFEQKPRIKYGPHKGQA